MKRFDYIRSLVCIGMACMLFTVIACKKGDMGPEGPKGEQGEKGDKGDKGDIGNANVQVYEKDIQSMIWTATSTYSYLDISAPQVLTASVISSSTILVYVLTSDFGGGWGQVPYYTERKITVTAEILTGRLRLLKNQNGSPSTQSWHSKVRVIIIKNSTSNPGNLSYSPGQMKNFIIENVDGILPTVALK